MFKGRIVRAGATVLALACLLSFAGCENKPGKDESKDDKIKLVIWEREDNEVLYSAIADYESKNPNVRIVVETQGETSLEMAVSAGTAPDIIWSPSDYIATYGKKGFIVDLTPYGGAELKDLFTEPTWITANAVKDKIYSLPFDANIINFCYNKDMFDSAGAKVPTNFDEMLDAANKIKAKYGSDGQYFAYTAPFDSMSSVGYKAWETFHYYWWLWRMGGDIFNEDYTQCLINSPEAVEALQMLVDLKKNGLASDNYRNAEFIDGKVGMMEMVTTHFYSQAVAGNKANFGVALMPVLKEGVPPYTGMGLYCYAVTSSCKNPQAAFDFLKFFTTNVDYQILYCKPYYFIPSLKAAHDDPYYKTEDWKIILEQAKYAKATPGINNWKEMDDAVYDAIEAAVKGTKTPQAALDAAAETIKRLMKE